MNDLNKCLKNNNFNMVSVCEVYRRQSTSKKICIAVTVNFLIMLTFISGAIVIEFQKVKNSQEQLPKQFFQTYPPVSMQEVGLQAKQLIMALVDYRMEMVNEIINMMKGNFVTLQLNNSSFNMTDRTANQPMCVLNLQNGSIFDCQMNPYIMYSLEKAWEYHQNRPSRRINIVYQNLDNLNDVMIQTISQIQDLQISNITRINKQFSGFEQGYFQFSTFYPDAYGVSTDELVSFHSKAIFSNYRVLVQIQTYGGFLKTSITRVIYSDDTNMVVLCKNISEESGYSLVSSFKTLNSQINYTSLLTLGHAATTVKDQSNNDIIIYSYTMAISSLYKMGAYNFATDKNINQDYVLIIHNPSVGLKAEKNISKIINNLQSALIQFLIFFAVLLCLIIGTNTAILTKQIHQKLKTISISIKDYAEQPIKNFNKSSTNLYIESTNQYWFGGVMRAISDIIKNIQRNKKRFRLKCQKREIDEYPLNLLQEDFLQKFGWNDFELFARLKEIILNKGTNKLNVIKQQSLDELKDSKSITGDILKKN